jgi:2-polyprenyl-3-methyl-5-hydroxy-6-metoxy-1,4-benzoquinol methylase
MRHFEKPSHMFRWALENFDSDDAVYKLPDCFPQYWAQRETDGYLWQQYDRRLEALVRNARKGRRILEIGSGFGTDAVWAALSGAEVVGLDVKSAFIEIGRRMQARIERAIGTELKLSFERTNLLEASLGDFDFIYMKDVFHHLEPRNEMVEKIANLLRRHGELLIVEPNALNPLIQLQMFRIRGFKTIISKTDPKTGEQFVYGNERLVSGAAMRRAFAKVGVEGRSERFRLLPTALGNRSELVRIAKALEAKHLDAFLPPLCIHTIFHGRRVT